MATRALVIDGIHSKGAIWKNGDGYPNGMGKDIIKFINKTGDFDIQEFYKLEYNNLYNSMIEFNERSKYNGYEEIPAKEYVDGRLRFSHVDTAVTPAYLKQIRGNNYNGILANKSMLDAAYTYVVLKDGLYVSGTLTKTEENLFRKFDNNEAVELALKKSNSYRRIFMKDGKLHFVDIDKKIHQVTIIC